MTSTITLYSYWRSSCAWRVRIALNLKEIPYICHPINLAKGEQNTSAFRALNPLGLVPILLIDHLTLFESVPILEYLDETRPKFQLLPDEPARRAVVRAIVELINASIQPIQNLLVLGRVESITSKEERGKWAIFFIQRGLKAVEKVLETSAGKCCHGDQLTFADCFLVPQLYNARRFGVQLEQFPNIIRVEQYLSNLPAFRKAHPDAQPDAVL